MPDLIVSCLEVRLALGVRAQHSRLLGAISRNIVSYFAEVNHKAQGPRRPTFGSLRNSESKSDILGCMLHRLLCVCVVFAASSFAMSETVQILDKDGKAIEGLTALAGFTVKVNGSTRKILLADVLSVHNGEPASPSETARIQSGLAAIQTYKAEAVQSEARRNAVIATPQLKSWHPSGCPL